MNIKHKKGINIQLLNLFFIILTAVVFLLVLTISIRVTSRFHGVMDAIDEFIICEQSSELMKKSADDLTDNARLFIVTQDPVYVERYLKEVNENNSFTQAIEKMSQVCDETDLAYQRLMIAMEQAQSLMTMEMYAIRLGYRYLDDKDIPEVINEIAIRAADLTLSKEELKEAAINNLFGEGYMIYRARIDKNCTLTVEAIEQQIKDELDMNADELGENLRKLRVHIFALLIINVLLFVFFGYLIIRPLELFQRSIKNDEKLDVVGAKECRQLAESYNEIYERKAQTEQSLLKKAEYDALTGILNRRAFDEVCAASEQRKEPIALLLIDFDNFKNINDTYGHAGGDLALKELARLLSEAFRSVDYVARIGGDEFAAILLNCPVPAAETIKNKIFRINEALSQFKEIKPLSISVGVAFSDEGFSQTLFKNADSALYLVKEKGKRGCEVFKQ